MLWALTACTGECNGIGCNTDQVTSALHFYLNPEGVQQVRTPEQSAFQVTGSTQHGDNWGFVHESPADLLIGSGSADSVFRFPFQIGKKELEEFTPVTTTNNTAFGSELHAHNPSDPYYLISAPLTSRSKTKQRTGSLYIYNTADFDTANRIEVYADNNGDMFPSRVWLCGDIDNDGIKDWMASKSHAVTNSGTDHFRGEIVVGQSTIWNSGAESISIEDLPSLSGEFEHDGFGHFVDCKHDINEDGLVDVLISSPFRDSTQPASGAIYIYTQDLITPTTIWQGTVTQGWFGYSFAIGDINGDSELEISTFTFANNEGQIKIWSADTLLTSPELLLTLQSEQKTDFFGKRQQIQDLDGDGFDELLISAPHHSYASTETGAIFTYAGTENISDWINPILSTSNLQSIYGNEPYQRLGERVFVADVDGDSRQDIITQVFLP